MSEETQYLRMLLYEWDIREDVNQALGISEDFMQDAHGTISEISFKILAGPRPSRILKICAMDLQFYVNKKF